ncbi:MAG: hypothetical protein CMM50_08510 [Rhodospirillaceae bacterium]|nr:hypothetical protein [Rhodospirillaceae bacterium]
MMSDYRFPAPTLLAMAITGFLSMAFSTTGSAQSLGDAVLGGRPLADLRFRFEHIDQAGFARDAEALTLRARLGYETLAYEGFSALAEIEAVTALGPRRFDDGASRPTGFPVVPDADTVELNQGFLTYQGLEDATFRIGRQRIALDNQRFIGNVGFRQNEQTFDAVTIHSTALDDATIDYGFISNVKRVFGEDAAQGDLQTRTHYLNVGYGGLDWAQFNAYAYLIDIDEIPTLSSQTTGGRMAGAYAFRFNRDLRLLYAAEFAWQRDYADNPADYGLPYVLIEPGLAYGDLSARLGYEVLAGNGTSSVQTPLGTLHAFQGATDKFVVTPPDGIRDLYLDFVYRGEETDGPFSDIEAQATVHSFRSEESDTRFGREWYARITKSFRQTLGGTVSLSAEYAFYDAESFSTDTHQLWLTANFRL